MTTGATGQLGLALPVQGELSGTWGDTVNNGITQYTNIAIAGTLTLTGDGAVTLANTTGDASASNITSTLAGAGTVTAQFAIVRVTGTLTTAKVVTGPSYSKTYTVVNAATGGIVTFKASGQTGVSVAVGESAFVYFNGTDYVKIVGTATAGAAGGSNTQVQFNSSGILVGSANMTFNGTTLTVNDLTDSSLTATRVVFAGTAGNLTDSANLTWNGTSLSATQIDITAQGTLRLQDTTGGEYVALRAPASLAGNYTLTFPADDGTSGQALITDGSGGLSWSTAASGDVYGPASATANGIALFDSTTGKLLKDSAATDGLIYGLTVGRGAGAVSSNTALGASALAANSTGARLTAVGASAGAVNTASDNSFVGYNAGVSNTSGINNTSLGSQALYTNISGGNNTAIGYTALLLNTGSNNTAVGGGPFPYATLGNNSSGGSNTAVGTSALAQNTTASGNTAVGYQAGYNNLTGAGNFFGGDRAGWTGTATTNNTAVGAQSLYFTTGNFNTAVGNGAGYYASTGVSNTSVGYHAFLGQSGVTTGSYNTAIGQDALASNTTASGNTAVGYRSGISNNTGAQNVFVGVDSAYWNTTGTGNVSLGYGAFASNNGTANGTGSNNVAVGREALANNTTGSNITAIGYQAGYTQTTSTSGTVIGHTAGFSATTNGLNQSVFVGHETGYYQTGGSNTAIGYTAFLGSTTPANNNGYYNTAIGISSLRSNIGGISNTAVGHEAGYANTSGAYNVFIGGQDAVTGKSAGYSNTTASVNTAIGNGALATNITGGNNTAVGYRSLNLSTVSDNTAFGAYALSTNSTGGSNVAVGRDALQANTTASNSTAVGYQAAYTNQTGTPVTALGYKAGYSNLSGNNNIFIGYQSGYTNSTASFSVFVGHEAGYTYNGSLGSNTHVGYRAGYLSTGDGNTFVGARYIDGGTSCGSAMTTGSKNTILGSYSGNQGSLDLRTANNYVVLSDGDGNPRQYYDSVGNVSLAAAVNPSLNTDLGGSYTLAYGYKGTGLIAYQQANHIQTVNAYYQGGWKRGGSGAANYLQIAGGSFIFDSTDSGAADSAITWTEVLRVQKDQTVALQGGATSISGTGITFPATQSASSNANTLDDYEEGTWTPVQGTGLTVVGTFSSNGHYIKIGRQVTITGFVTGSTSVTATANGIICTGLPFQCMNVTGSHFIGGGSNAALSALINVWVNQASSTMYAVTTMAATGSIFFTVTYFTD
jgi:hypothetical protein